MSLRCENVTYRHPGADQPALGGLSLEVQPGRIVAVTGPSGVGKTTLGRLMAGLLTPDSGTITCDGRPVGARRGRLPRWTALLAQDPLSAADPRHNLGRMISLPARLAGKSIDVVAAAAEVGLGPELLERLPEQVSGGQLQRACLARALAQQPSYLIADEATAHLDPDSTQVIAMVLRRRAERGLGILAITHDHQLARDIATTARRLPAASTDLPRRGPRDP
ncbi:UNVERIFIED_ORG: peptide/nickel transport system ATP-binding protein [Dietzia maris]|uniref:ABC transporter ATP-binding protein n=1 Tax=Dietzia maris TaxID=37915 RepID=UPI0010E03E1F